MRKPFKLQAVRLAAITAALLALTGFSAGCGPGYGGSPPNQNPGGLPAPGMDFTYALSGNTITFTAPFLGSSVSGAVSGNRLFLVVDGAERVFNKTLGSAGGADAPPLAGTDWTRTYYEESYKLVDTIRFFTETTGIMFTMTTENPELY